MNFLLKLLLVSVLSCENLNQKSGMLNLKINKDYNLSDKETRIKVIDISDSRCPKGARCIIEGFASIKVRVVVDKKETILDFRTDKKDELITEKYKYKIIDLIPYPELNKSIDKNDYVVVLSVKPR